MSAAEVIQTIHMIPPSILDVGILALVLSLVEVSPIKLNPWQWLKSFYLLPSRLDRLEREFKDDRAFRWRSMIINRADKIEDGKKLRREVWKDTMLTIDNYEKYCDKNPDFKNELAKQTIDYLREKYKEVREHHDYWGEGTECDH